MTNPTNPLFVLGPNDGGPIWLLDKMLDHVYPEFVGASSSWETVEILNTTPFPDTTSINGTAREWKRVTPRSHLRSLGRKRAKGKGPIEGWEIWMDLSYPLQVAVTEAYK